MLQNVRSLQVLIVDDSPKMRRMIRGLVAPYAAEIFECADGAEAFSSYQLHHPDLVLMDISLGESDGIGATRRICAADPHARVVMVTDYDDAAMRQAAADAGACGYVVKENLLELREILGRQSFEARL